MNTQSSTNLSNVGGVCLSLLANHQCHNDLPTGGTDWQNVDQNCALPPIPLPTAGLQAARQLLSRFFRNLSCIEIRIGGSKQFFVFYL